MRRITLISIILFLIVVPLVQAQETNFDLTVIADGDVIEASFVDEITTQLYAFYGTAGDSVSISMIQEDDALDPFIVLFDSEGAVLDYDDDSGELDFSASLDNIQLDNDGVYFVMATSVLFVDAIETETSDELPYTLTVSGQTRPENVEDADVISLDIEILSIGNSIAGNSTEDAPLALFYLEASAGDSVTISLEDADYFTLLMVFAPDGSRLVADASLAELDLEEDGIYTLIATEQFFYQAMDTDSFFEGGSFVLVIE